MNEEPGPVQPQPAAAGATPAPEQEGPRHSGIVTALRETVFVVVVALVVSLLVKTFLLQAFYIPSESMEDTLQIGDRVIVSKLTPGPFELHRGDIVVFEDPGGWLDPAPPSDRGPLARALTFIGLLPEDSNEHLIKRVVGLPGDRIMCCDDQARMTVNGVPVEEPYVHPGDPASSRTFEVEVPEGRLWVMGDHRERSEDSRFHPDLEGGGTIPVDAVTGRAFTVIWPVDHWAWLGGQEDVFAEVGGTQGVR
ncbi:signal peptidase I [Kineococcus xinjiangensis]|uniref:Signal peptidase I n=1 Tax=Kineococcus xinjiangensis TaxID=512762 RepID=A0A2S6IVZ2_9ACTN|nr:signal peptidase I [Kineococcus xinjiangensis]PPK98524.1 signal peptidase I [Kineococcus xinjiangensis]